MTARRPASVEAMCLKGEFEELRTILASEAYALHRQRPLATWVENADRRLPIPFLSRTVGEILQTPFHELQNTPGVGHRKLRTLICLLERVRRTDARLLLAQENLPKVSDGAIRGYGQTEIFDPGSVSEVVWAQWRAAVARLNLDEEPLGRLATSLRKLVRTLWHEPLKKYLGHSLAELQRMRIYGDRRVNSILEVFFHIHRLVGTLPAETHLAVRLLPHPVAQAEYWVGQAIRRVARGGQPPSLAELNDGIVRPLVDQLRVDTKPAVVQLAVERLGLEGQKSSIRQIARRLGLTRARIYQLLREIAAVMDVRWPLGREMLRMLLSEIRARTADEAAGPVADQLELCLDVFFGEEAEHSGASTPKVAKTMNRRKKKLDASVVEMVHFDNGRTSPELVSIDDTVSHAVSSTD